MCEYFWLVGAQYPRVQGLHHPAALVAGGCEAGFLGRCVRVAAQYSQVSP